MVRVSGSGHGAVLAHHPDAPASSRESACSSTTQLKRRVKASLRCGVTRMVTVSGTTAANVSS